MSAVMPLPTVMTARELNRDVSAAKRAANEGPVMITDRGEAAYVLLSIDDFRALQHDEEDIVTRLRMDDDIDVDFGPVSREFSLKVPEL